MRKCFSRNPINSEKLFEILCDFLDKLKASKSKCTFGFFGFIDILDRASECKGGKFIAGNFLCRFVISFSLPIYFLCVTRLL